MPKLPNLPNLLCIDAGNSTEVGSGLTEGKVYVQKGPGYRGYMVRIINDNNEVTGYYANRFIPALEAPQKSDLPELNQKFKADVGKLKPTLLFEGMPRALYLVVAVLSYGAQKYEAHSWKDVEMYRYKDAKLRHWLDELAGLGAFDAESGLVHAAHEICNALFLLEDKLSKLSPEAFAEALKFNPPPTGHKK